MSKVKTLTIFTLKNFGPIAAFYILNHFLGYRIATIASLVLVLIDYVNGKNCFRENLVLDYDRYFDIITKKNLEMDGVFKSISLSKSNKVMSDKNLEQENKD